ncbi:MAG TPA: lysylphosphatidylglycerol synthase transmembrane domain-containing protein [Bryobacteraceae bacterium]|nr:lysylphosphatidylglycerol synthase transmembrane domain-containing protein [Bryobacteraceae bacterium]
MTTSETPQPWQRLPKWLVPTIGYAIGGVSLFWVLSKFPYAQLGEHLRSMDWRWVAVAIGLEFLIYFIEAWRWKVILRPVGAPSFASCIQAVFVGLFANDLLPARAGEIIRCFLLSYKSGVALPLTLTSDLIMRLMDGVWMVAIYVLITWQISAHVGVNRVMWIFGASTVFAACLLLWVLFHRQHAHHFCNNTSWAARFIHLLEQIHDLGHWRELGQAMAISGLYWTIQVVALWAIARADSFEFPLTAMAFLLVVRSVGTMIPNAPANMGAYQAAVFYGLVRLFTEPADAKILAEIMFLLQTVPLAIGGALAVASAGFNLTDLRRHADHAHRTGKLHLPQPKGAGR